MEKNRMMRLASCLLVLTLLTTCMISGTFAKYTTAEKGSDTARVAKWGVTISTHTDLFATSYESADANGSMVTVKSTGSEKLVAPGTTGTGLGVASEGIPEVSYEMKIKLDNTTAKMPSLKYTPSGDAETSYEPVKFNVYNGDTKLNDTESLTLSELKGLFSGTKAIYRYDVNTNKYYVDSDLDGSFTGETPVADKPNIKIGWEWAFESGADDSIKALNNELDTILGNTAAAAPDAEDIEKYSAGAISDINTAATLNWTVTATQID